MMCACARLEQMLSCELLRLLILSSAHTGGILECWQMLPPRGLRAQSPAFLMKKEGDVLSCDYDLNKIDCAQGEKWNHRKVLTDRA